jgi:hypothetical protein
MLMQARNILKYFARIGALRDGMVVLAMVRRLHLHIIDGSNETTIKKIRRCAELIWRNLVLAVGSPRLLRSSVLHLV